MFKGQSINTVHKEQLKCVTLGEFVQLFNEEFTMSGELSLSDFSKVTFKTGEDVSKYYQKKKNASRKIFRVRHKVIAQMGYLES